MIILFDFLVRRQNSIWRENKKKKIKKSILRDNWLKFPEEKKSELYIHKPLKTIKAVELLLQVTHINEEIGRQTK